LEMVNNIRNNYKLDILAWNGALGLEALTLTKKKRKKRN